MKEKYVDELMDLLKERGYKYIEKHNLNYKKSKDKWICDFIDIDDDDNDNIYITVKLNVNYLYQDYYYSFDWDVIYTINKAVQIEFMCSNNKEKIVNTIPMRHIYNERETT